MILTEYKTTTHHYFRDEDDEIHGLYQSWYSSGSKGGQIQANHGLLHGEYKFFQEDGSLSYHKWYEHDKPVLNFLDGDKYPTTGEDRLIFKQKYQGEFLPN